MYFAPLAAVVFAWRAFRHRREEDKRLAILHAIAAVGIALWIARNAITFAFPAVATGAGVALFFGANPLVDGFDRTWYQVSRDAAFVAVSRAPRGKLEVYQKRMGWSFPWLSSFESDFNRDFGVTFTQDEIDNDRAPYNYGVQGFPDKEAPGVSVFYKDESGTVYHTYSAYGRGIDLLNGAYNYIDLVPKGRDEGDRSQAWVRRHDEY